MTHLQIFFLQRVVKVAIATPISRSRRRRRRFFPLLLFEFILFQSTGGLGHSPALIWIPQFLFSVFPDAFFQTLGEEVKGRFDAQMVPTRVSVQRPRLWRKRGRERGSGVVFFRVFRVRWILKNGEEEEKIKKNIKRRRRKRQKRRRIWDEEKKCEEQKKRSKRRKKKRKKKQKERGAIRSKKKEKEQEAD